MALCVIEKRVLYSGEEIKKEMEEQAYRVAWRNILDWVEAQMALLEIEMAKIEEIFLPYMVNSTGETFFERIEQRGFLLEAGEKQ